MALNETNNKRQYTQYKRHVNESKERVNAKTVNSVQADINDTQIESNDIKDKAFEERVYTIFNNDLFTNAMFIDYFKDGEFINDHESDNIKIEDKKRCVVLDDSKKNGLFKSIHQHSAHGENIPINDFFLITNEFIPVGAKIEYFLELETGQRYPIEPNQIKLPLHLTDDIDGGFKVVAKIKANAMNESPVINGYAILYWDSKTEENYGMTNPDLMRFP